ncbi:MAG TPA: signal recognition particle protein [Erysipelotrichaceae bacterium]|nr:signal recognition particle protein [Erysipelotrichaceae bacterium]
MAFDRLTEKLTESFRRITKQDRISEKHLDTLLSDVRLALLDADVNTQVVNQFLEKIQSTALNQKILSSLKPNEALMKLVYDELVELLGPDTPSFDYPKGQRKIILFVGLQGTGKTTSAAKLAQLLRTKKERKVLLVAADLARPAAIDQLEILAGQAQVSVYVEKDQKNSLTLVKNAMKFADKGDFDTIIVDTAGRLAIDEALMLELKQVHDYLKPDEVLLTVDAMTGQDVIHTADGFNKNLKLTGLVVTKFDADAKGGAVLSVKALTGVPVKLVGTGEKLDDTDIFYPDRMANRLIGMGDLLSLVEQAQEKMDVEAGQRSMDRIMEGLFTFDDMLDQFNQLSKMGSLQNMLKMIPGASQLANQVNDNESNAMIKKNKAIILSMTPDEREDASLLRASRKNRIAKGSGTTLNDVNKLINQYEKAKEQMRMLKRLAKNNPNMR